MGVERKIPQLDKEQQKKATANIIPIVETLNVFPLRLETRQGYLLSKILFMAVTKYKKIK